VVTASPLRDKCPLTWEYPELCVELPLNRGIGGQTMSEYAVERARQMFQARQSREARPQRRTAVDTRAEPSAAPDGDVRAGELIGTLHLLHSRLRQLDGWLREEHRLNLTEMHVLSMIPTTPSVLRRTAGRGDAAARLAGDVGLSPSGLTRLVDRLVARGLLARVDDVWDGRVTHLVLTEEGRAVRDAVLPRAVEHIRDSCGEGQMPLDRLHEVALLPRSVQRPQDVRDPRS
jgi:DNA-binding MarR family transcriptional regulator